MKNILQIVLLYFVGTSTIWSQKEKGFYFSVNSGYNFEAGKSTDYNGFYNFKTEVANGSNKTKTIRAISLGKGFNVNGTFGYSLNKNIGIELGLNYLLGAKQHFDQASSSLGTYANKSLQGKMFQIKPTLVFTGNFSKINPYTKIGLVIGSGKIVYESENFNNPQTYTEKIELSGDIALGYNASAGILYKINSKLSFFSEINIVSLNFAPTKGTKTEWTKDGASILTTQPITFKEYEFSDSYEDNGNFNSDSPKKEYRYTYPFSSIGISVGLRYGF
jgi:hypothetical protein